MSFFKYFLLDLDLRNQNATKFVILPELQENHL